MNKSLFLFIAALSPLACLASMEQKVEKSFQVQPGGLLKVDVCKGRIEVASGKDPVVRLVVLEKISADTQTDADQLLANYDLKFTQDDKGVQIVAKQQKGFFGLGKNNKVQFSWLLTVPESYNLNLDTAGGSIRVGDLTGDVRADTSGGSIDIGNILGAVDADTSGGHINLASSTGKTRLDTSGGSISAGTLKGPSLLDTSGGSISVKQAEAQLKANTSGGSIDVSMPAPIRGECVLDTSGGSVIFHTDTSAAFHLEAESSGGRVSCDLPITVKGSIKSNHLEGDVNGGGPKVTLSTSGGSVHVVKLK